MEPKSLASRLIQRETNDVASATPLTIPVYETTTFVFDTADDVRRYQEGKSDKYLYSRYENPTVVSVETVAAALDDAEKALLFSSGMAATATTLLALTKAGDEVVCSAGVYGGTLHLLKDVLSRFGVRVHFVTTEELAQPEPVLTTKPPLLWFESPINPTLRCVDIRSIASACRAAGVLSVIDNTFASPINQQPLALGVDLSMQSATKYLNGHSDVTAGVISGPRRLLDPIGRTRRLLGTVLDPYPAYALGRGIKTLAVRIERQNTSALAVARALERDSRVGRVYYPGLESDPDHGIAKAQMTAFGGVVTLDLDGSLERASRCFDRLRLVKRAVSLGGVESLASLPVLTSHWGHSDEELARAGITKGMVRLSVGLEDPDDLIADLDQALK